MIKESVLLLVVLVGGALSMTYPPRYYGGRGVPDRVEVVSSALRVLPRRKEAGVMSRQRREASWRKPRDYQFVTRDPGRPARLLSYPEEPRDLPAGGPSFNRRQDFPMRRVIYYATLPEIVRRPGEWTPPRPIYPGYPPVRDNEVVTRVQSGLIDVSNTNGFKEPPPRFTIIDAEPPYNRPQSAQPLSQGQSQQGFITQQQPQQGFATQQQPQQGFITQQQPQGQALTSQPQSQAYARYNNYRRYQISPFETRNQVDPYRLYRPVYRPEPFWQEPQVVTGSVKQELDVRPLDPRPVDIRPEELSLLEAAVASGPPQSSTPTSSPVSTTKPLSTDKSLSSNKYERKVPK